MSTSKLQRRVSELLSTYLGQHTIRENTRPEWLHGLELDFLIEELSIAIEVQGDQHYRYIPHFHLTPKGFRNQLVRDDAKRDACATHGITLFDVTTEDETISIIEKVASIQVVYEPHRNYVAHELALQVKKKAKSARRNQRKSTRESKRDPIERWTSQIQKLDERIVKAKLNGNDVTSLQAAIDKRRNRIQRHFGKQVFIESINTRKSGRKKHVKTFDDDLYLVWGGREQHVVWFKAYEDPAAHICDCRGWLEAKNHICSHVFAIAVFLGLRA